MFVAHESIKLNDDKTELIINTNREGISRQEDIAVNIGDSPISPSMGPPRNLGVVFDSTCCLITLGLLWHPVWIIAFYREKLIFSVSATTLPE